MALISGEASCGRWSADYHQLPGHESGRYRPLSSRVGRTLSSLSVTRDGYLEEEPETGWHADRDAELERKVKETEKVLEAETKKLEELKTRIAQETGSKGPDTR